MYEILAFKECSLKCVMTHMEAGWKNYCVNKCEDKTFLLKLKVINFKRENYVQPFVLSWQQHFSQN